MQKDSGDSSGPDFDWDNDTIKGHSNRKHSRLFLETCFTLANENSINRHIDIPEVYRTAINNILIENVLVN